MTTTIHRRVARATAALFTAALLCAGSAAAKPAVGSGSPIQAQSAQDSAADPFAACRAPGGPTGVERTLCFRAAANQVNEQVSPPAPGGAELADVAAPRPILVDGGGFDWSDAGVGFAAAAGIGLLGAGSAAALRARRRPLRLR